MRNVLLTILISTILVASACRTVHPRFHGRGDAGAFIVQLACEFGDRTPPNHDLPAIKAPWHYEVMDELVVVHLPATSFAEVERVLRLAFGPPSMGPSRTIDDGLMGVYRRTEKGGGILFSHDNKKTEVGILAPLTREESRALLDEIFASEEFQRAMNCGAVDE